MLAENLDYSLEYEYDSGFCHRVSRIGEVYYKYDSNGNVVAEQNAPFSSESLVQVVSDFGNGKYGVNNAWGVDFSVKTKPTFKRIYEWNEKNLLSKTIEDLKKKGLWFVCADMKGKLMYELELTGPIGLVIGNEGDGVSRLVREKCDMTALIPMHGDIDSLNASVAAGVLAYEIVRQRSVL